MQTKRQINGRIYVNGKTKKPSYEVKVDDVIEVRFGNKISKFKVGEDFVPTLIDIQ